MAQMADQLGGIQGMGGGAGRQVSIALYQLQDSVRPNPQKQHLLTTCRSNLPPDASFLACPTRKAIAFICA